MGEAFPTGDGRVDSRFDDIVRAYGGFLRGVIARFCPSDIGLAAGEIEQEARIRLWRALASEKEIENLPSYLYRMAANVTIDAIRKVKSRREDQLRLAGEDREVAPTLLPPSAEISPHSRAERREMLEKIGAALAKLPENRRRAVKLHLHGMTPSEIGNLLGWSEAKARNLVYRGRNDLADALKKMGIVCEID